MIRVDDLVPVSVDDHLVELPDLFVNHLAPRYLDRASKLVRNAEGSDVWIFGDTVVENPALNAVLDRLDRTFEMHRAWTQQDIGGRLPSEVFREHVLTNFISDQGFRARARLAAAAAAAQ